MTFKVTDIHLACCVSVTLKHLIRMVAKEHTIVEPIGNITRVIGEYIAKDRKINLLKHRGCALIKTGMC